MDQFVTTNYPREPWNKGKLVGQKTPLKIKDIWAIRVRLQISNRVRDLALFNLAIDSKLRACDLVNPSGTRCVTWWPCVCASDCHAAKDPPTSTVRDHRGHTRFGHCLDYARKPES